MNFKTKYSTKGLKTLFQSWLALITLGDAGIRGNSRGTALTLGIYSYRTRWYLSKSSPARCFHIKVIFRPKQGDRQRKQIVGNLWYPRGVKQTRDPRPFESLWINFRHWAPPPKSWCKCPITPFPKPLNSLERFEWSKDRSKLCDWIKQHGGQANQNLDEGDSDTCTTCSREFYEPNPLQATPYQVDKPL